MHFSLVVHFNWNWNSKRCSLLSKRDEKWIKMSETRNEENNFNFIFKSTAADEIDKNDDYFVACECMRLIGVSFAARNIQHAPVVAYWKCSRRTVCDAWHTLIVFYVWRNLLQSNRDEWSRLQRNPTNDWCERNNCGIWCLPMMIIKIELKFCIINIFHCNKTEWCRLNDVLYFFLF